MARLARIETLVGMPLAEVNEVALRRFVDGASARIKILISGASCRGQPYPILRRARRARFRIVEG